MAKKKPKLKVSNRDKFISKEEDLQIILPEQLEKKLKAEEEKKPNA